MYSLLVRQIPHVHCTLVRWLANWAIDQALSRDLAMTIKDAFEVLIKILGLYNLWQDARVRYSLIGFVIFKVDNFPHLTLQLIGGRVNVSG